MLTCSGSGTSKTLVRIRGHFNSVFLEGKMKIRTTFDSVKGDLYFFCSVKTLPSLYQQIIRP